LAVEVVAFGRGHFSSFFILWLGVGMDLW
jgi:hypothetical protein